MIVLSFALGDYRFLFHHRWLYSEMLSQYYQALPPPDYA